MRAFSAFVPSLARKEVTASILLAMVEWLTGGVADLDGDPRPSDPKYKEAPMLLDLLKTLMALIVAAPELSLDGDERPPDPTPR